MKLWNGLLISTSLITVGCSSRIEPPSEPIGAELDPIQSWESVLKTRVDDVGRVNFAEIKQSPAKLEAYVKWISSHGPKSTPEKFETDNDRLAHYLNAYNALAMYGVIKKNIPTDFDGFFKRLSFFVLTSYKIDGEYSSLYDYENNLIRKLGDPRVHVALNCMSVGCPRLPQTRFHGETLDEELDAGANEFFNSKKYAYADDDKKVAYISEILDFFTDDFVNPAQSPSIISYVNKYRNEKIPEDYRVSFLKYDWTINKQ